jgi:RimJ/RimL family protein N-acetyltransferase
MQIALVSPFPATEYRKAWRWLREFPERNFDDTGPRTYEQFVADMEKRAEFGERTWGAVRDGTLCGIIGYRPITHRYGSFHGICFPQSAWGRDTTMTAVRLVLKELFAAGIEKVSASFFSDNTKIYRFFMDLGAREEGFLEKQTERNGELIDMRLLALFKEDICHSVDC